MNRIVVQIWWHFMNELTDVIKKSAQRCVMNLLIRNLIRAANHVPPNSPNYFLFLLLY